VRITLMSRIPIGRETWVAILTGVRRTAPWCLAATWDPSGNPIAEVPVRTLASTDNTKSWGREAAPTLARGETGE